MSRHLTRRNRHGYSAGNHEGLVELSSPTMNMLERAQDLAEQVARKPLTKDDVIKFALVKLLDGYSIDGEDIHR